jgi:hypothetical protein
MEIRLRWKRNENVPRDDTAMNETSELVLRDSLPPASEYMTLFESTGWNRKYRLSTEELQEAIRHSWFMVAAHDQNRLVGTGRVISDGVFHALVDSMSN